MSVLNQRVEWVCFFSGYLDSARNTKLLYRMFRTYNYKFQQYNISNHITVSITPWLQL